MLLAASEATIITAFGLALILVAVVLTWRQQHERQNRPTDQTDLDARHYQRQDRRRYKGAIVLGLVGLGIALCGQIDIRGDRQAKLAFLLSGLAVMMLSFYLLILALLDLWSTRNYANRKRRALAVERRKILEAELAELRTPLGSQDDLSNPSAPSSSNGSRERTD